MVSGHAFDAGQIERYVRDYGDHNIRLLRRAWREFESGVSGDRTLAEALASELKISLPEARTLAQAVPSEIKGKASETLLGYMFDFTPHVTPEIAAKLRRAGRPLKLEVNPRFHDSLSTLVRQGREDLLGAFEALLAGASTR